MTQKKERYDIKGMTCSACAQTIERKMNNTKGVSEVAVNLMSNHMDVTYEDDVLSTNDIKKTVKQSGYKAINQKPDGDDKQNDDEYQDMKRRLWVSIIFILPLFYIYMGSMLGLWLPPFLEGHDNVFPFAFIQFLLVLPVIMINRAFYTVGFKGLIQGSPNMDNLIAIGTSAAMIYGVYALFRINHAYVINDPNMAMEYAHDLYFETAGIILLLITVGKFLESKAKGQTSGAIRSLMELSPDTAIRYKDGQETQIPTEQIQVDDVLVVKPGSKVPVDGVIIKGNTSIDESMLTGESIPIEKNVNDQVIGASINKSGAFQMKATRIGQDTTLAKIIQLVEDAQNKKAPIARLADRISRYFVPIVMAISLLAAIFWSFAGYDFTFVLSIAIAVLVISCPCALGLATPTAIMTGTGRGAQMGILIKNGEILEGTGKIDTVVLDKTGTITHGKPIVTDIIADDASKVLQYSASAEKLSEHPLADAVIKKAEQEKLTLFEATDVKALSGKGLSANIEGKKVFIGNQALMEQENIPVQAFIEKADELSSQGKSLLFVAIDGHLEGLMGVMDTPKPSSKKAIEMIQKTNRKVIMLTGDHKKTAEAIAKSLGLDDVIAQVLPSQKAEAIEKLKKQGKTVAMVGDGINDAPALTAADIGIAIGSGTDVAIESADIILMKDDLMDVSIAMQLSERTLLTIKQNLFWAFIYNVLCIPLAAGLFFPSLGIRLSPEIAAGAMSISSVTVVLNALRLKAYKPKKSQKEKK